MYIFTLCAVKPNFESSFPSSSAKPACSPHQRQAGGALAEVVLAVVCVDAPSEAPHLVQYWALLRSMLPQTEHWRDIVTS